jgi:hypothetical protein
VSDGVVMFMGAVVVIWRFGKVVVVG